MKRTIISIYTVALLMVVAACGGNDPMEKEDQRSSLNQTTDQNQFDSTLGDLQNGIINSDPFTINAVSISGSTLLVEVAYAGGCETHDFELLWPEAIIAIHPPEFGVILNHNASGDMCEAFIHETLEFDLNSNPLGLNSNDFSIMKITVINGSDPSQAISNR